MADEFTKDHARLVAIEQALGLLLLEVCRQSKDGPRAVFRRFEAGMVAAEGDYIVGGAKRGATKEALLQSLDIADSIRALLTVLLEGIDAPDDQQA